MESQYIKENVMTGVISEQGNIGILAKKRPNHIFCNGEDITEQITEKGMLYTIALENKVQKSSFDRDLGIGTVVCG